MIWYVTPLKTFPVGAELAIRSNWSTGFVVNVKGRLHVLIGVFGLLFREQMTLAGKIKKIKHSRQ